MVGLPGSTAGPFEIINHGLGLTECCPLAMFGCVDTGWE